MLSAGGVMDVPAWGLVKGKGQERTGKLGSINQFSDFLQDRELLQGLPLWRQGRQQKGARGRLPGNQSLHADLS